MSEQTTNTEAVEVRADQLERRQHIIASGNHPDVVARVEHVLPYRDGDGHQMVAVMAMPVGGGDPLGKRWRADAMVPLATEKQVATARDEAARQQLQDDLVAFQALLGSVNPRLRIYGRDVSFRVEDGEVNRIAAALGLPIGKFGTGPEKQVTWTAPGGDDLGPRLSVQFWGRPAPEPEPAGDLCPDAWHEQPSEPTEPCRTCGDPHPGAAAAPAAEQEHRLAGGSAGGNGACSAVCLCGLTYAGFDTHREAAELIEQHVAEEAAKAKAGAAQQAGE
ncbi:hypothetical protein [Micromonospora globbae]|uniref:hypothetical protein n=1 Tax=Micromonospora globbae TaxID=1894969 RepID=UPI003443B213